ncbi:MAG: DUF4338 domain-containing protein [Nanoarchaeota archaeon]|nr:DUF4338 domain-containing protein [Nanoarchaeota archaeon]
MKTRFQGDFRHALLTHYPHSKAVAGRQLLYKIFKNGKQIGFFGVQSTTRPILRVVKEIYNKDKVTEEVRNKYSVEVLNNNIFRLYQTEKNLASKILSRIRKLIKTDYEKKYPTKLRGIISLTFGINEKGTKRVGICYKADNWKYIGLSGGNKKVIKGGRQYYEKVEPKHIWLWKYKHIKIRNVNSRK